METFISPDLLKRGAEYFLTKAQTAKSNSNKDEVINSLSELINELIRDKNDLIFTINVLEQKLVSQFIKEDDLDYIINTTIPTLLSLLTDNKFVSEEQVDNINNKADLIKKLLSKEILRTLQLIGFNYKQALGEPLTELAAKTITKKISSSAEEISILNMRFMVAKMESMNDSESYKRAQLNKLVE